MALQQIVEEQAILLQKAELELSKIPELEREVQELRILNDNLIEENGGSSLHYSSQSDIQGRRSSHGGKLLNQELEQAVQREVRQKKLAHIPKIMTVIHMLNSVTCWHALPLPGGQGPEEHS